MLVDLRLYIELRIEQRNVASASQNSVSLFGGRGRLGNIWRM